MKKYKVSFFISNVIEAENEESALDQFMEDNNVDSTLKIYCDAEELGKEIQDKYFDLTFIF